MGDGLPDHWREILRGRNRQVNEIRVSLVSQADRWRNIAIAQVTRAFRFRQWLKIPGLVNESRDLGGVVGR